MPLPSFTIEDIDDELVDRFKKLAVKKGRIDESVLDEPKDILMDKHASKPYNPSIANIYYLAGFIENWGRGIEKICSACEADGTPPPKYTVHPSDIMIKFTASEDRIIRIADKKVNENEQELLSLLFEDP